MDLTVAAILGVDGAANGAIYALLAIAIVLLFAVTRVIFVAQGEFVAFGALTLGMFQAGRLPGTVGLLLAASILAGVLDVLEARRRGSGSSQVVTAAVKRLAPALLLAGSAWLAVRFSAPLGMQAILSVALVTALGPCVHRVVYRSLADASTLVLLIVSVGVHFVLLGLGLVFFGAEGVRTPAFWDQRFTAGPVGLGGHTVVVWAAVLTLIAGLWLFFTRTLHGKALQATAIHRLGAQLVGISTAAAAEAAFAMAAFIGGLSGLLIGATTTVFYDSGFLIGLKGFVAAVFGGLASYPAAFAGAMLVGWVESFSSFWASAFKETIVFTAILPFLVWRSLSDTHGRED
jgi:branched-chain amino acid transport system permease protein